MRFARGLKTGDVVEINGEYESGSTLGFYLRRQVRILNGRSSNLWYGSLFRRRAAASSTTMLRSSSSGADRGEFFFGPRLTRFHALVRSGVLYRPQRRERDLKQPALNRGEAAHLAIFEGEMLAPPRHGIPRETPDPDAKRHHIAQRQ